MEMLIAIFRTVILYLLITVGLRVMGKRQVGELEPTELVMDLLIADLASVPMQDLSLPLWAGVFPIFTLLLLTMLLSALSYKSIRFRSLLWGRPSIILENGKLNQAEMRKNRLTLDEFTEELRLKGITDISSIKYAILETNGQLSILLYADQTWATPKAMGLSVADGGLPVAIISDGRVLDHNLYLRGYDQAWLEEQLKAHNVNSPRDVYLLSVDELGRVYYAPKEKKA